MAAPPLQTGFFDRETVIVARELLGKILVRRIEGNSLAGIITETEAYNGETDLGCHAKSGKTKRNCVMYGPPGHAYVYFTYGMHWCLNCVTREEGFPAAVLIRAIQPISGIEIMRVNRKKLEALRLTDGPAKICQALSITGFFNGIDLCNMESDLFITRGIDVPDSMIKTSSRIGLNNVPEPWQSLPWRFRVEQVETLL